MEFDLKSDDTSKTIRYLCECFDFSGECIVWKIRPESHFQSRRVARAWNTRFSGTKAGSLDSYGYLQVKINGKLNLVHRIIWLIANGYNAKNIDHIDGNTINNKIENLRDVTHSKNMKNQKIYKTNKTGLMGVHWLSKKSVWLAKISNRHIGQYECLLDACSARKSMEISNSFHENHGAR